MKIGKQLQELRGKVSRDKLAAQLGANITPQQLYRLEKNRSGVSIDTLRLLAKYFGKQPSDFHDEDDAAPATTEAPQHDLARLQAVLDELEIPKSDRGAVYDRAADWAKSTGWTKQRIADFWQGLRAGAKHRDAPSSRKHRRSA